MFNQSCGCQQPRPTCGCNVQPMPRPTCGCNVQPMPRPTCGCNVQPMPRPTCGCQQSMPSCGCNVQPMPRPTCGCQQPMPSCGCQQGMPGNEMEGCSINGCPKPQPLVAPKKVCITNQITPVPQPVICPIECRRVNRYMYYPVFYPQYEQTFMTMPTNQPY